MALFLPALLARSLHLLSSSLGWGGGANSEFCVFTNTNLLSLHIMPLITICDEPPLVLPVITAANMLFLHPDSGPQPLKSKSKQLTASSSPPTTPEVPTCAPTPSIQTDPAPSSPAPSTPAPHPPEPSQVEMTSADDDDAPHPDENKSQEVKKDAVESEVCFSQDCASPVYVVCGTVAYISCVYLCL